MIVDSFLKTKPLSAISNQQSAISRRGFSLIELLVVIGIIGIIGAASAPNLSRFLAGGDLTTATDKVVRTLRKAQNYSLSGKRGSAWGVHHESELLVLFKGNSYAARDPSFDEKFGLPRTATITGWSDIYFQKLRGQPSQTLSVTIAMLNEQKTITVNSEGRVDVQ